MNKERAIQDKLNNMQQAPAGMQGDLASVWERLEVKLESRRGKRRVAIAWRIAALFVLITGIGLLVFWHTEPKSSFNKGNTTQVSDRPVQDTSSISVVPAESHDNIITALPTSPQKNTTAKVILKQVDTDFAPPSYTNIDTSQQAEVITKPIDVVPLTVAEEEPVKPRLRIVHINELQSNKALQQKEERWRLSRKEPFIQLPGFFPKRVRKGEADTLVIN